MTTAQSLLEVCLGCDSQGWHLRGVQPLHTDLGIYFGIARWDTSIFVVARNRLTPDGPPCHPSFPTDNILELDVSDLRRVSSCFSSPEWVDVHQIRAREELLWVMSGRTPELVVVSPRTRSVAQRLALSEYIPADLRHPAPEKLPEDPYHFNSLHFAGEHLFALAHNWEHGSFCLEFECADVRRFFTEPRLVRVWRGLGTMAHDVFLDHGELVVLDSGSSVVLRTDGLRSSLCDDDGHALFLRGLGVTPSCLFVGAGEVHSERDRRATGRTWLRVLDRETLAPLASLDLGLFGNTMDVHVLDEVDPDAVHPRRRA